MKNTSVVDTSYYQNNLSCAGSGCPNWNSSGVYEGAFSEGAYTFDGSNDLFNSSTSSTLEPQNLTIETWVNLDPTAGVRNAIVTYGIGTSNGGPGDGSGESYGLIYHTDIGGGSGTFRLRLKNSAGNGFVDLYNDGSSPAAQVYGHWVFVVATWNGSDAKIYQNGVELISTTGSGTINYVSDPNSTLRIGNWFGNNERWFKGRIDNVRIYNRSLSSSEVLQHYQTTLLKYNPTSWMLYSNAINLSEGSYHYEACINDISNALNCTGNYMSTIDNSAPVVSLIGPENNSAYAGDSFSIGFDFNYADALSPTSNCSVMFDGSSAGNNATVRNSTNTTISATVAPGSHSWYVSCKDLAGNAANSSIYYFTGTRFTSSGSDSSSSHTTLSLSVAVDSSCNNNTITTNVGSVNVNVVDENSGATIYSGTTDDSGNAKFNSCGRTVRVYANRDGYRSTDNVFTLDSCSCLTPAVVPPVAVPPTLPLVVAPEPTPTVNQTVPPAPVVPNPNVPTLSGPTTGSVGDNPVFTVGSCVDCTVRVESPDGRSTVLTPTGGSVSLPLILAGTYRLSLVRNGEVVSSLSIGATAPAPVPTPTPMPSPTTVPPVTGGSSDNGVGFALMVLVLLVILGGIAYYLTRRR